MNIVRMHVTRLMRATEATFTRTPVPELDVEEYGSPVGTAGSVARGFTEEHQARLKERHLDGYHKLRSARTIGGFILSEAVAQRLEKLARQDDTIDRDSGPPWEYYEEISGAYADALTDIRAAAKKDLKVE